MVQTHISNRRINIPLVISLLRRKILNDTQILNPSQQLLHNPVPSTSTIPRQLMTRKLNLIVRQPTLITPLSYNTSLTESTAIVLRMEGHVELFVLRVRLVALFTVPCNVLKGEKCAVGGKDEV